MRIYIAWPLEKKFLAPPLASHIIKLHLLKCIHPHTNFSLKYYNIFDVKYKRNEKPVMTQLRERERERVLGNYELSHL